jgi:type II secretory pathway component PulC
LPLKLWGTIASQNPELAWASVEMLNTRETGAFQVGDPIDSATLVGIERRRVVLLENGSRRGLSLDEEMPAAVPKRPDNRRNPRSAAARSRPRTRAATRRPSSARRKQEVAQRVEIEPEEVQAVIDNPASIYSQARILPQLADDGSIAGLQISGIQPGSVFERAGILEGEVITEINGVAIGDGDATQILSALTDQGEVPVKVRGEDGDRSVMVAAP